MQASRDLSIAPLFKRAGSNWRGVWTKLLFTDVAYKILEFVILAPLVGVALRLGIGLSGDQVLADQDILFFLLRPVGLLVLTGMLALRLALVALEQAGLMTIGLAASQGVGIDVMTTLRLTLGRASEVISLAMRLTTRCLAMAAPFLAALGLIYFKVLGEFDINYYLAERPPAFRLALGLAILLALGLASVLIPHLISWSLALPLVMFEGVRPGAALVESHRRVKGHRLAIARVLVVWGAGSIVASFLLPSMVLALGRVVGPIGTNRVGLVLGMVLLILILWLLVSALVSWVSASLFALLVGELYGEFDGVLQAIGAQLKRGGALKAAGRVELSPGRLLGALGVGGVLAAALGFFLIDGVRTDDDVLIIAHRGASLAAPENTMAAIEEALVQTADVIEIDVQETRDGEVAVIHDSDLMKIGGRNLKIWDATWSELRAIDIGSWFDPEFSDQRVPHLREVLEASRGRAMVDIELKYYGHDEDLEQRVADVVDELDVNEQVIAMSLKYDAVRKMKALRPDWSVGLLTATAIGDLTRVEADFLAVNAKLATRAFVRRAHERGMPVYAWTVNDPVQMFRMVNHGVDGLITDVPGVARAVLQRRAELNSAERLLVGIAFFFGASVPDPPAEVDTGPATG
jgi:glycerophosphoryl diester phosphodiesterase